MRTRGEIVISLKNCFKDFKSKNLNYWRHIGYMEACLNTLNVLETEKVGEQVNIKVKVLKKKTWYRGEVKETVNASIIRQTESFLNKEKML